MGKRQIGEMEPSEFVVTMLIANLAAVPMQDNGIPLFSGLVPILTVLAMELILSVLSMKVISFRQLFCGKPVILIEQGKICQDNLRRTRIHLDELTEHLREKDIMDLTTVKYAILETNGEISVFPYAKYKPANAKAAGITVEDVFLPYTIISDGKLLQENLEKSGRSMQWLNQVLHENNCTINKIFLLTVDDTGKIYLLRREAKS